MRLRRVQLRFFHPVEQIDMLRLPGGNADAWISPVFSPELSDIRYVGLCEDHIGYET